MFIDVLSTAEPSWDKRGWTPKTTGQPAQSIFSMFCSFSDFCRNHSGQIGVRATALLSSTIMLLGAAIKYSAVSPAFVSTGLETARKLVDLIPCNCKTCIIGLWSLDVSWNGRYYRFKGYSEWFREGSGSGDGYKMAIAGLGVFAVFRNTLGLPISRRCEQTSTLCPTAPYYGLICFSIYFFLTENSRNKSERGDSQKVPLGSEPQDTFYK